MAATESRKYAGMSDKVVIPVLSNDPVLVISNDPETVGNSVSYDVPVLGQGPLEELENRFRAPLRIGELPEDIV